MAHLDDILSITDDPDAVASVQQMLKSESDPTGQLRGFGCKVLCGISMDGGVLFSPSWGPENAANPATMSSIEEIIAAGWGLSGRGFDVLRPALLPPFPRQAVVGWRINTLGLFVHLRSHSFLAFCFRPGATLGENCRARSSPSYDIQHGKIRYLYPICPLLPTHQTTNHRDYRDGQTLWQDGGA